MPKPSKPKGVLNEEPDDLDVDEEEVEEEDVEEEEEEDVEEEEAEEEEEAPPPKKTGKRSRPKGSASKKSSSVDFGVVLVNGIPAKVEVVAVRGEIAKVRKPGSDDTPIKIASALVRVYDEDTFSKMQARAEKISALKDANIATHQKMATFKGKSAASRKPRKGNPLEGLL